MVTRDEEIPEIFMQKFLGTFLFTKNGCLWPQAKKRKLRREISDLCPKRTNNFVFFELKTTKQSQMDFLLWIRRVSVEQRDFKDPPSVRLGGRKKPARVLAAKQTFSGQNMEVEGKKKKSGRS